MALFRLRQRFFSANSIGYTNLAKYVRPRPSRLPHNDRVVLCGGLGGHRVDQGEQRRRDWPRSGLARLEVMLQGLGPRRTVSLRPSGTGRAGRGSNAGGARLSGIVTENSAVGPSGRRAPPPSHFLHGRQDSLPMARLRKQGVATERLVLLKKSPSPSRLRRSTSPPFHGGEEPLSRWQRP